MTNSASMVHFLVLSFKVDKSARFPKTNERAPKRMDLPAPVSPVIVVKPESKLTFKSSINAKFFIDNRASTNQNLA